MAPKGSRFLTLMLAAFMAVLVLPIGCAGEDPYASQFANWSSDFYATVHHYMPNGTSVSVTRSQAEDFASALTELASRLAKMKPLSPVRDGHIELIQGISSAAQTLLDATAADHSSSVEIHGLLGGRVGSLRVPELVSHIQETLAKLRRGE